jgi:hypothetical protein
VSKRKCFRIFGFIVFAVVLCFHGLYADDFSVSSVEGKIGLKRNGGSFVSLKGNESLNAGDFIRSYRDSAVIFSSNGNYYKLFSYGAMRIEERPVLIYGKLSRSDSQHFLDAQFYFSPKQPLQGQTMKAEASCFFIRSATRSIDR